MKFKYELADLLKQAVIGAMVMAQGGDDDVDLTDALRSVRLVEENDEITLDEWASDPKAKRLRFNDQFLYALMFIANNALMASAVGRDEGSDITAELMLLDLAVDDDGKVVAANPPPMMMNTEDLLELGGLN
jgi:hypothetical protein